MYNFLVGGGSQRFDLVLPSFELIYRIVIFTDFLSLQDYLHLFTYVKGGSSLNHVC